MRLDTLTLVFVAGLMAAAQAAELGAEAKPQDPHNPLIGKWHFIGFGKGPTTELLRLFD